MSDVIVLKIGGSVAGEDAAALDAIAALSDAGHDLAVVHGGGPLVGEWATRLGLETRFVRGLRVTDEQTRDLALAILGGLANGRIVDALIGRGVPAVAVGPDPVQLDAVHDRHFDRCTPLLLVEIHFGDDGALWHAWQKRKISPAGRCPWPS